MKVLKKLLYAIPLAGMIFASCTDVEKMEIEHIGGFNTMDNEESEDKKGISDFCSRQYGYHLHVEWCSGKI